MAFGLCTAFRRVGFIDVGGNVLIAAAVGVNLAHNKEGCRAFLFRGLADGVINVRLAAIEAAGGDRIERLQRVGFRFRQLFHAAEVAIAATGVGRGRIGAIEIGGDAPVAAVAGGVAGADDIKGGGAQLIRTFRNGIGCVADGIETTGDINAFEWF